MLGEGLRADYGRVYGLPLLPTLRQSIRATEHRLVYVHERICRRRRRRMWARRRASLMYRGKEIG